MPLFKDLFNNMTSRFDGGISGDLSDGGRIPLIIEGWDIFISSTKNIIFGNGYFLLNPHNEYLRNFFDSGLVAGILHLVLLILLYMACRKRALTRMGHSGYVNAIFLSFLFMLSTYGHTKTFWVGLAFSWIVSGIRPNRVPGVFVKQ